MIDDKKNLSEKCEMLVKELKTVDKKYQDKIKTMDEKWEPIAFFDFKEAGLLTNQQSDVP